MIGRLIGRLLGIPPYTDEHHAGLLDAALEQHERIVGTCSACGQDLRLLREPTRAVCGCGTAIPEAFFAHNQRRHT